jgi:hypothetical protein
MCKEERGTYSAMRKDVTVVIVRVRQTGLLEIAIEEGLPKAVVVNGRKK